MLVSKKPLPQDRRDRSFGALGRRLVVPIGVVLASAACSAASPTDAAGTLAEQRRGGADEGKTAPRLTTVPFKGRDGVVRDIKAKLAGGHAWVGDMGLGRTDGMKPISHNLSDPDTRWPNSTIPYCFYDGADDDLRLPNQTREAFREATRIYEAQVPSLRFNESACSVLVDTWSSAPDNLYTSGPAMLVVMAKAGSGGRAHLGYENEPRGMWLSPDIGELNADGTRKAVGTVVHELGHSLGLAHEHQRSDRNQWVSVCLGNIPADDEGDYDILDPSDHEKLAPYDYRSKMHYDRGKGSSMIPFPDDCDGYNLKPLHDTTAIEPGVQVDTASRYLSFSDVNTLTLMYGKALGTNEIDDRFGSAIATADFDLDGFEDMVVGAPQEKIGSGEVSGTVYAYKGTWRSPAPWKLVRESALANEEAGDRFGSAFAVGDFGRQLPCDEVAAPDTCEPPFPDLAVGMPGKRIDTDPDRSGAVMFFLGGRFRGEKYASKCGNFPECVGTDTTGALTAWPGMLLRPSDARTVTNDDGDEFGFSLAAGDFDGDGDLDLAVGAPGRGGTGRIFVYSGKDLKAGNRVSREYFPPAGANSAGARFGFSLAAGDFDLDGKTDLAVGAPGAGTGAVVIYKGNTSPLLASASLLPMPTGGALNTNAEFGYALAARNLLNTSRASLVVGAPKQSTAGALGGAVHLYTWGPRYGTTPQPDGLGHRQAVPSPGTRERFGHSVSIYSVGTTWNNVAVGAPMRSNGRGGVDLFDATSATNLAPLSSLAASSSDVGFGSALATGEVKIELSLLAGIPQPAARLFVGSPTAMTSTMPAGRVSTYGFVGETPYPRMHFTQSVKSPYAP